MQIIICFSFALVHFHNFYFLTLEPFVVVVVFIQFYRNYECNLVCRFKVAEKLETTKSTKTWTKFISRKKKK